MMRARTACVRVLIVLAALLVVCLHASLRETYSQVPDQRTAGANEGHRTDERFDLPQRAIEQRPTLSRRLFSISSRLLRDGEEDYDDEVENSNCTDPLEQNDTCSFVYANCSEDVQLFNYLGFVACTLPDVKPVGYILLVMWLLYLISLIGTTADYFFVPPLTLLSDKLKLSPSIAGITLLALGNGAPDVFTAISALQRNNLALLFGALIGAAMFTITIVLGSVLAVSRLTKDTIDKIDFMRDITIYAIVVAVVVTVAYDGMVTLLEAAAFPILYILYIAVVVLISYLRKWWNNRRMKHKTSQRNSDNESDSVASKNLDHNPNDGTTEKETMPLLNGNHNKKSSDEPSEQQKLSEEQPRKEKQYLRLPGLISFLWCKKLCCRKSKALDVSSDSDEGASGQTEDNSTSAATCTTSFNETTSKSETTPLLNNDHNKGDQSDKPIEKDSEEPSEGASNEPPKLEKQRLRLAGLTLPPGKNIFLLIQWAFELPFSLLRWLTIPSCYHDGQWSIWHSFFTIVFPIPALMLLLLMVAQFEGFTITLGEANPPYPLYALLIKIGFLLSVTLLIYFIVTKGRPPHWALQGVLGLMGFVMAIAWLNLVANELVSVLEALGLAFNIDSAILGLTVLAIGNSVADWVANMAVAKAGHPGMAISSCYGAPLLKDVLGYSMAFIVKVGFVNEGRPFRFNIHSEVYSKVKLSWIFVGVSLAMSFVVFPLLRFKPPKEYGIVLCYIYFIFMLFNILDTTGVMPIYL